MQTVSSNIAGPSPALKQVYLPNSNAEVRTFRRAKSQTGVAPANDLHLWQVIGPK